MPSNKGRITIPLGCHEVLDNKETPSEAWEREREEKEESQRKWAKKIADNAEKEYKECARWTLQEIHDRFPGQFPHKTYDAFQAAIKGHKNRIAMSVLLHTFMCQYVGLRDTLAKCHSGPTALNGSYRFMFPSDVKWTQDFVTEFTKLFNEK